MAVDRPGFKSFHPYDVNMAVVIDLNLPPAGSIMLIIIPSVTRDYDFTNRIIGIQR